MYSTVKMYVLSLWCVLLVGSFCLLGCGGGPGALKELTGPDAGGQVKVEAQIEMAQEPGQEPQNTELPTKEEAASPTEPTELPTQERSTQEGIVADGSSIETHQEEPECSDSKPCLSGRICRAGQCFPCKQDSECEANEICESGSCQKEQCNAKEPCTEGKVCRDGRCIACKQDGDCGSDEICESGVCQKEQCNDKEPCADGRLCTKRRCLDCKDDASCQSGQICDGGRCLKGCRSDKGCTQAQKCNTLSKTCVSCLQDSHCSGGKLCKQEKCVACQDDKECAQGTICSRGSCIKGNCHKSADCATAGQVCRNHTCGKCLKDSECSTDQICASGTCRAGCRHKADCKGSQVCDTKAFVCVGCVSTQDCGTGLLCKNRRCSGCAKDSECGKGNLCVNARCRVGNCRSVSHCSSGQVCRSYMCGKCQKDSECGKGKLCISGVCRVGDCRTTSNCTSGLLCKQYKCSSCRSSGECGKVTCKDSKQDCLQIMPGCVKGRCSSRTHRIPQHYCNAKTGRCVRRCRDNRDCRATKCSGGGRTTCTQILDACVNGRCTQTTRKISKANCVSSRFCVFQKTFCRESYEGAQLTTAIYPSESLSALPKKFKLQKTIYGAKKNGVMMFFTSDSPQTVCHVVFKGVSPSNLNDLMSAASSGNSLLCKTSSGKTIGHCGLGFYSQFEHMRRQGIIKYIQSWTLFNRCPGGLRIYGHSMGGAHASLLASELNITSSSFYSKGFMRVYTYGAPRLYRIKDGDKFHKLISLVRWTNDGDPVPSVPLATPILGFKHFGSAYEIKQKSSTSYSFTSKSQDFAPVANFIKGFTLHKYTTYRDRLKYCK